MRTRSSRFFVILLHLVGVCHHHRLSPRHSGIVGVNPWPVQLESLPLSSYHDDNQKCRGDDHTAITTTITTIPPERQLEPIWLQDRGDLSCLGPTGTFTECGDATLWFLQPFALPKPRMPGREKRLFLSGLFAGQTPDETAEPKIPTPLTAWTFQVVDRDYGELVAANTDDTAAGDASSSRSSSTWWNNPQRRKQPTRLECLDYTTQNNNNNRRHRGGGSSGIQSSSVDVLPCRRRWGKPTPSTGVWLIDENGFLQVYDKNTNQRATTPLCLHRQENGTDAILVACPDEINHNNKETQQPVQFSFVRYRAVTVTGSGGGSSPTLSSSSTANRSPSDAESKAGEKTAQSKPQEEDEEDQPATKIPHSRDKAHAQASDDVFHPELSLSSQLLFRSMNKMKNADKKEGNPFNVLKDTNPILLMGGGTSKAGKAPPPSSPSPSSLLHPPSNKHPPLLDDGQPTMGTTSMKIRPIQKHPYIEEAKNEIWTDPQTGLEYYTDLSKYLGYDRKERGRHTLTGVGQYRKGYVIKVYGIAYYVSKRDVLADPTFDTYARMSDDELRARPDFYNHLRKLHYQTEGTTVGKFERTLMLKTNMQLSAETMRSSLQADWRMLTEEAKDTLIGSSMRPRPADENMLRLIQSPENPSRCSCSQVAPPEYQADPDCCARGTELVFTWLKNGDMAVRLNGQVMEVFPRPDIAEGIFFEYLRHDDPISTELRERVVDGFPFLLAPLAQIKGMNMGQQQQAQSKDEHGNRVLRAIGGLAQTVSSHAEEMIGSMQRNVDDAVANAGNAARSMQGAAQRFADEMARRRELILQQSNSFPEAVMNLFMPNHHRQDVQTVSQSVEEQNATPSVDAEDGHRKAPLGRVFGYPLTRWFGETYYFAPDEIGPMIIHPTMNTTRKVFLALVHLYLLLLFIVSFPGSYSTRTKLVIRKSLSRDFSVSSASSVGPHDDEDEDDDSSMAGYDRRTASYSTKATTSRSSLLRRARKVLRPQKSDDLPLTDSEESATLKKKSFSYFL